MNQRTHSWIAIRAIALLEDENHSKRLVDLLKPHARTASVGAWIPDQIDAKRGGCGTDNHILKIKPYRGNEVARFTKKKDELLKEIGPYRMVSQFLQNDRCLDEMWWGKPYKGDVDRPGQHVPNRIMALCTMMKDLLLMGDPDVDQLLPGKVGFIEDLDAKSRTSGQAAALYFFMLSHFMADVSMPCHCDARKLSGYEGGLHKELETHWSKKVGTKFERKNLLATRASGDQILQQAREIDDEFDLHFDGTPIPDLLPDHDPWLEAIYLCLASFAVASIIAPYQDYPYDNSSERAEFDELLGGGREAILTTCDQFVLHDAVLDTAILWKHVWNKVSKD